MMEYGQLDEKLGESMSIASFAQARNTAEIENSRNPNNAHNWTRWGTALMGLSYYCEDRKEIYDMIDAGIAKFKKALSLNPNHNEAKQELLDYDHLVKGYNRPYAGAREQEELPLLLVQANETTEIENIKRIREAQ